MKEKRIVSLYHIYSREMFYDISEKRLIKDQEAIDFRKKWNEGEVDGFLRDGDSVEGCTVYGQVRWVKC